MADVAGHLLTVTTLSEKGRNLLMAIKELDSGEEKSLPAQNLKSRTINTL